MMRLLTLWVAVACGPDETGPTDPTGPGARAEICDNGVDDDLDGDVDCDDVACSAVCAEACVGGIDEDLDGAVDCEDSDCDGQCPEACTDGRDNDGDGELDCADEDCDGSCPEDCNDVRDNDGDGVVDCWDSDCDGSCPEDCLDVRDNDGDGATDCEDADCDGGCPETCEDGRDNDGDGGVDCVDVDCDGQCPEVCLDGRDNDGDSDVDCADAECRGECDADADGFDSVLYGGDDCDDTLPDVHPGGDEVCNEGIDDDCDGLIDYDDPSNDPGTLSEFYVDTDLDGYGTGGGVIGCSASPGFSAEKGDCAPSNPDVNPGATEICNALLDDDCDGFADDDDPSVDPLTETTSFRDSDGDGLGDPLLSRQDCIVPAGWVVNDLDCDDTNDNVGEAVAYLPDLDLDGFGAGVPLPATCDLPLPGEALPWLAVDCNDADPLVHPDAVETCVGGVDDDCDALVDEDDPSLDPLSLLSMYMDADADGFGDGSELLRLCELEPGFVLDAGDCNDLDAAISPAATEVCNEIDDDCDVLKDDSDPSLDVSTRSTFWFDRDGDGFGDPALSAEACTAPVNYVDNPDDCDDNDASEGEPLVYLYDDDADGFGAGVPTAPTCTRPGVKYVLESVGVDCDDLNPLVAPDAIEVCDGGIDNDCDALPDDLDGDLDPRTATEFFDDDDSDGFGWEASLELRCVADVGQVAIAGDCDDTSGDVHPNATEICNDFVDDDCDLLRDDGDPSLDLATRVPWFPDNDLDGFGRLVLVPVLACNQPGILVDNDDDCDDFDPAFGPAIAWQEDADNDGFAAGPISALLCDPPGPTWGLPTLEEDCDDLDDDSFPAAPEVCEDGVDQNCDGTDIACIPCSEVAEQWCLDKGWTLAVGGEGEDGNIVCTNDGSPASDNCDPCGNYNVVVWVDGSDERECPGAGLGLESGTVYGGHSPCACGGAMAVCDTWSLSDCVPD